MLLMCLLAGGGNWLSTRLSLAVGTDSCIWLANGIVAAFVLTGPKRRKIPLFAAGHLAILAVDLMLGTPLRWALWFGVSNSVEVLIIVLPLRHFSSRSEVATRSTMGKIALFGIFLGPLISGMMTAPAVRIIEGRPLLEAARIWFLADALGCAATLPALLFLLTHEKRKASAAGFPLANVAWALFLLTVALAVFWQTRYPLLFLLFPPLVAAPFRFKLAGAIYGTSIVVVLAAAFTAEARGPLAVFPLATAPERVLMFQIFGLVTFASCVPLGFALEERFRLERDLKQANRKLSDLALLDSLTGLQNRRGFDATLASEWAAACARGDDLSLVYLDIDYFKRFNDSYGHPAGDDCLRWVASALVRAVRTAADYVARYGGEEFVILLPATSATAARIIADRAACTIQALAIPHQVSPFGVVTASFGIATVHPRDGGSSSELIRLADAALYAAKRGGRGRIETHSEPHPVAKLSYTRESIPR